MLKMMISNRSVYSILLWRRKKRGTLLQNVSNYTQKVIVCKNLQKMFFDIPKFIFFYFFASKWLVTSLPGKHHRCRRREPLSPSGITITHRHPPPPSPTSTDDLHRHHQPPPPTSTITITNEPLPPSQTSPPLPLRTIAIEPSPRTAAAQEVVAEINGDRNSCRRKSDRKSGWDQR